MAVNKWQISDELWEKMVPLLSDHRTSHPLGTHRKRVDNQAAMNAFSSCSEQIASGMHSMRRVFAHQAQLIAISRNVARPGFSSASGKMVSLPAKGWMPLTGHGCRWMAA